MSNPRVVSLPFTLGRADRVDPKVAPLGVLATAKNLRVRKDGRLASRNGYELLSATTPNGTLVTYDVSSYRQRLVSFGSDGGDGYPVDLFEYNNVVTATPWKGTDSTNAQRVMINPMTNCRERCGIPQPDSGMSTFDSASGLGYVCIAYRTVGSVTCFYQIVRETDDQVIASGRFVTPLYTDIRVTFASGSFWFVGPLADNSVVMCRFTPGTDLVPTSGTTIDALSANPVTAFEVSAVGTPATGVTIVAVARAAATTVTIKRWTTAIAQEGSTNTVALAAVWVDVDADAGTTNKVNLATVVGTNTATVRVFNYATNAGIWGPTTLTAGRRVQLTHCYSGVNQTVCTAVNTETGTIKLQWFDQTFATGVAAREIFEAQMSTRLVSVASNAAPLAIIIGGWVEPQLATAGAAFISTSFPTNALWWVMSNVIHMSTRDLSQSSRFLATSRMGLSIDTSTLRAAWCATYSFLLDQIDHPVVTCFDFSSKVRRNCCEYSGSLYIPSSCPSVYDGHLNTEIGFNEVPGIQSVTPSTSTGALASSATYIYVTHWERALSDGTVYQGPVSLPFTATTGVGNNTNTLVCTTPHCLNVVLGTNVFGADVTLAVYRTQWDAVNNIIGGVFKRCSSVSIPSVFANYGQVVSVVDTMSDATLATQVPVYSQADRGPINAPLIHNAPEACSYMSVSSARILTGALARPYEFQESKESFLGEPVNFSEFPNFFGKASSEINGVVSLDGVRLICSRERIFAVLGKGPSDTGAGALPSPVEVAAPSGLQDWKSLVVAPDGVYFQLDTNKLYRISKGGTNPEWIGIDIQDTLALFPSIIGAARCRQDDVVAFAMTTATDARIAVRSLRTGLWLEDTPPLQASKGIEAMCEFGSSLAYVSGGRVYIESQTNGFADAGAVIPTQWKTPPVFPFGLGGYGQMFYFMVTGEYRSDGVLSCRFSYDDGITFTAYDSFTISALTVGSTVQKKWAIQQSDFSSCVMEFTFTPSSPGEGFIIHQVDMLVDALAGLKQLDPGDLA